jgi:hypothetical protein
MALRQMFPGRHAYSFPCFASALEMQNPHNDAFDVEQVTKRFLDNYTKVYFDLQEGRRVLQSRQPQ